MCKRVCVWTIWIDVKLLHVTDVVSFFKTSWMFETRESLFVNYTSRGPGTHDCLSWPTKTRQHGGENVPAQLWSPVVQGLLQFHVLIFAINAGEWHRAKPRTLLQTFLIVFDFTLSQNWDSHWFRQVCDTFLHLFFEAGISSLRGTWASAAWVLSISWWVSSSTEISTG